MNYILIHLHLIVVLTVVKNSHQIILESIATCGMFITSTIQTKNHYRDFLEFAIRRVYFDNPNLQTFILQNTNTNETLLPHISKSMKYDCLLDIHFNFEVGIFSTMPYYKPDKQIANVLYKRNLFLVMVVTTPYENLLETKDWVKHLVKEYKVFVLWIVFDKFIPQNPLQTMLFFFCAFCENPLVHLPYNSRILQVSIKTFMKSWKYAEHNWVTDRELNAEKYASCKHINLMDGYDRKFGIGCDLRRIEYQLMKEITR